MIFRPSTNDETTGVFAMINGRMTAITAMYIGDDLFWELVRSCFGKGYWINEQPWINEDAWKNNA